MNTQVSNSKVDTLINAVMTRWPDKPYRLIEQASDAAVKALKEGKPMRDCIEVAKQIVNPTEVKK